MDRLAHDLQFSLRTFARRPAFTFLVILAFGLGVGATTAMFSVVDAVLLRPLPYPDPQALVAVYPTFPEWRTDARFAELWDRGAFSHPEYAEFRARQRSFAAIAAFSANQVTLLGRGEPEIVPIIRATPSIFDVLRVRAEIGRLFANSDPTPVVVLSHALWQTRYGGSPAVLGQQVELDGVGYPIVGVLPADAQFAGHEVQLWRSIVQPPHEDQRNLHDLYSLARLRPGTSVARANDEAARLIGAFSAGHCCKHGGRVVAWHEDLTGSYRMPFAVLIAAAFLLLLAACTSVATMLLGSGIDRERELAIRSALGAARSQLVSQLLTEGMVLGAAGGALGVVLTLPMMRFLLRLAPAQVPMLNQVVIDIRVLGFALLVAVVFAVAFTLVPAVVLSRTRITVSVGSGRVSSGGRGRLERGLVITEIALATLLLTTAGLLTRSMAHLDAVDPGFAPNDLLTVRIAPDFTRLLADTALDPTVPIEAQETGDGRARVAAYFDRLVRELESLPGVGSVAVTSVLPFSVDRSSTPVRPEGYVPAPGEMLSADRRFVSVNYLRVMGMRLVAGRDLSPADDRADAPGVVVVNEALARHFWPGESAVGKRLGFYGDLRTRIVGVVRDPRERDLRGETSAKFYAPTHHFSDGGGSFLLRTRVDPAALTAAVRQRLWRVDRDLAIAQIMPMRDRMGESLAEQRYRMRLVVAFSILAAMFATMGVYGVTSRSAARRRRELGIRSALGAVHGDLVGLMLRSGAELAGIGLTLGLGLAWGATRVIESTLYDTRRTDPLTLAAIVVVMGGLALIAAWAPARRAARIEPIEVLRGD